MLSPSRDALCGHWSTEQPFVLSVRIFPRKARLLLQLALWMLRLCWRYTMVTDLVKHRIQEQFVIINCFSLGNKLPKYNEAFSSFHRCYKQTSGEHNRKNSSENAAFPHSTKNVIRQAFAYSSEVRFIRNIYGPCSPISGFTIKHSYERPKWSLNGVPCSRTQIARPIFPKIWRILPYIFQGLIRKSRNIYYFYSTVGQNPSQGTVFRKKIIQFIGTC